MYSEILCKICSSPKTEKVKRDDVDYIKCGNCGVFYIEDYPTEANFAKKFDQDFIIGPKEYLKTEHRRIFRITGQLELLNEISKYRHSPAKILDCGCGRGFFLDEARRHGYTVTGIEVSRASIYYCNNIGIPVFNSIDSLNSKFDIAVMHNALVKTPNPLDTMKKLHDKLNELAFVFIRVPYTKAKYWKILTRTDDEFFKQIYLQHYTEESLEKLLKLSGFEILKIEHKKPRNKYDRVMFNMTSSIFRKYFGFQITLLDKLKQIYLDSLKKEIFVVARRT